MPNTLTQFNCMICSAKDEKTNKLIKECKETLNHWNEINSSARSISFVADVIFNHKNVTPKEIAEALSITTQATTEPLKDLLFSGKIIQHKQKRKITYSINTSQGFHISSRMRMNLRECST